MLHNVQAIVAVSPALARWYGDYSALCAFILNIYIVVML